MFSNKKIIVMSDSHGSFSSVEKVVKKQPDADLYIFLGDAASYGFGQNLDDVARFLDSNEKYRNKFIQVRGNCDDDFSIPYEAFKEIGNHKILACHGHRYNVNFSLSYLTSAAKLEGCDIALYGHTHSRKILKTDDGLYIMNPGSVSAPRDGLPPSFGIIELLEDGTVFMHYAEV